jgi:hypothetical protein
MYEYERTLRSVTFLQGTVVGFMVGSFFGGVLIYAALGTGRADPERQPTPVPAPTTRDVSNELEAYRVRLDKVRLDAAVAISKFLPLAELVSVDPADIDWLEKKVKAANAPSANPAAAAAPAAAPAPAAAAAPAPAAPAQGGSGGGEDEQKKWEKLRLYLGLFARSGGSQLSEKLKEALQGLTEGAKFIPDRQ